MIVAAAALRHHQTARNAASRLLKRHDLTPPIDVESLLAAYATVHVEDWPYESVDAMAFDLGLKPTPRVFVRAAVKDPRRRFTLAHELGHVIIPWHFGQADCKPSETESPDIFRNENESQADAFASSVLLPVDWLRGVIASAASMTEVLERVGVANVSTSALLIALREHLPPGWIFGAYAQRESWHSPRTDFPEFSSSAIIQHARQNAKESGEAIVNGYAVQWYRMFGETVLPPDRTDVQDLRRLVLEALEDTFHDEALRKSADQSVAAIMGHLIAAGRGMTAEGFFNMAIYRLERTHHKLIQHPSFAQWIAVRARQVESGVVPTKRNPTGA